MENNMSKYNLKFISDEDLFNHVKDTIDKYRFSINLSQFNRNLIDPIKLSFDSGVYGKSIQKTIEDEVIRQIDKSNTNHIGYLHQNLFKFIGCGWEVPDQGFDIINDEKHIYVEMKNKHNTMNSSSAQKTYTRMQNKLLRDDKATCMLVEVMAKKSQNSEWRVSLDGESMSHERIRRVSIDQFYEIVTSDPFAFKKLCEVMPLVIKDVILSLDKGEIENSVFAELKELSPDVQKSLFLLSFGSFLGFNELSFK